MSASAAKAAGAAEPSHVLTSIERSARLWSGLVLMLFVTSHLLNHALGVFGLAVMSEAQEWRAGFWRSWPGSILLIGAAGTHVALSLRRVIGRRTWRMPALEALQIALGVMIPFLLIGHVVGTRVLSSATGIDDSYVNVLRYLWPANALAQSLALLVVWGHGVIGLYFAFHIKSWFKPFVVPLAVLAVLIPMLALAGFVSAGREALLATPPPESWTPEQLRIQIAALANGRLALLAVLALVLAFILLRIVRAKLGTHIAVRYLGHGEVSSTPGLTLLEISRVNGIPHPSACGGRGRCSSCRVLVLEGDAGLGAPSALEARMLERIKAPQHVRLACQIKPVADINVRVLLSAQSFRSDPDDGSQALDWGAEEDVTVLFADMRGFATLAENQLPADLMVMLGRVIGEMTQAVEARGGKVAMVQTDGIMAVFGTSGKTRAGSRAALLAAADILKAIQLVNKDMRATLPQPLRVGIGVHAGEVILSRANDSAGGQRMIVIGETVVIASRLEEVTKEIAADCIVSARTIAMAGFALPSGGERQVHYKNGTTPELAYAFGDRQELRLLFGRGAAAASRQAASSDTGSSAVMPEKQPATPAG
jgi:adenylate cyclase